MTKVRAVYKFEAQPNSGELSISVDEVLTVIKEGIEGGWLEGMNLKGQHGLIPEAYVEKIDNEPPAPPAPAHQPLPSYSMQSNRDDEWGILPSEVQKPLPQQNTALSSFQTNSMSSNQVADDDDFLDDDWTNDDEEDTVTKPTEIPTVSDKLSKFIRPNSGSRSGSKTDLSATDDESAKEFTKTKVCARKSEATAYGGTPADFRNPVTHTRSAGAEPSVKPAKMKSMNRFSNFVKSGMEGYILSTTRMNTISDERHEIILADSGPCWEPIAQPYYCVVDKPKKESKLKGLKSFIAYSVTSSLSGIQVSRRYKHFDWLHEQLSNKYILTPIPPLPEKQVAGRYEEELIEHRKNILQLWVDKICRHPVLSKSDVWIHFLTCTDEKSWKSGKRKAEKDEYVGGNFLNCVTVPSEPLDAGNVENQVETFSRCVRSLEDSVRVMYDRVKDLHVRLAGPYKTGWQKLAAGFAGLANSFELDRTELNEGITAALKECSKVYRHIADQHEESSKKDVDPLMDCLYTYRGLLANMPEIVSIHKSTVSRLHEHEKCLMEDKISEHEMEKVRRKVDSVSYAVLAEIQFQHQERGQDFKKMMSVFLEKQAAFYQDISKQLSELATKFQDS